LLDSIGLKDEFVCEQTQVSVEVPTEPGIAPFLDEGYGLGMIHAKMML
jgi:hypothetical protein